MLTSTVCFGRLPGDASRYNALRRSAATALYLRSGSGANRSRTTKSRALDSSGGPALFRIPLPSEARIGASRWIHLEALLQGVCEGAIKNGRRWTPSRPEEVSRCYHAQCACHITRPPQTVADWGGRGAITRRGRLAGVSSAYAAWESTMVPTWSPTCSCSQRSGSDHAR